MSEKQIRLGWMLIPKASIMRVFKTVENAPCPAVEVHFLLANHEPAERIIEGKEAIEFWRDFVEAFGILDDPELLEVVL